MIGGAAGHNVLQAGTGNDTLVGSREGDDVFRFVRTAGGQDLLQNFSVASGKVDSFNNLGGAAADIAAGSLPSNVTVLHDNTSSGSDEGRAMIGIANSVAPGAQYYFYSSGTSLDSFAAAVTALQATGCKVIVDDISISNECLYQTGSSLDNAITAAVAKGSDYFTSAGNSGNDFTRTVSRR